MCYGTEPKIILGGLAFPPTIPYSSENHFGWFSFSTYHTISLSLSLLLSFPPSLFPCLSWSGGQWNACIRMHSIRVKVQACSATRPDTLLFPLSLQFNLKLPAEVDDYYTIKDKCEDAGWEPGQTPEPNNPNSPHRALAQALMKRAIADLPIVQHIQKESTGMNKLYSQSMCSVNQWRAYQAAEALVSTEVEEVRAEADEIEPGWSQAIWRQAMQYHTMLKQKHEAEAKAAMEHAQKRKLVEDKVNAAKKVHLPYHTVLHSSANDVLRNRTKNHFGWFSFSTYHTLQF
jgi:hypothetical protein